MWQLTENISDWPAKRMSCAQQGFQFRAQLVRPGSERRQGIDGRADARLVGPIEISDQLGNPIRIIGHLNGS